MLQNVSFNTSRLKTTKLLVVELPNSLVHYFLLRHYSSGTLNSTKFNPVAIQYQLGAPMEHQLVQH